MDYTSFALIRDFTMHRETLIDLSVDIQTYYSYIGSMRKRERFGKLERHVRSSASGSFRLVINIFLLRKQSTRRFFFRRTCGVD